METRLHKRGDVAVAELCGDGVVLGKMGDVGTLMSAAFSAPDGILALRVENIAPEVFDLSTGILGELFQKLVNYRRRLVIVGDVAPYREKSEAFAALVRESNRGTDVAFVETLDAYLERPAT